MFQVLALGENESLRKVVCLKYASWGSAQTASYSIYFIVPENPVQGVVKKYLL